MTKLFVNQGSHQVVAHLLPLKNSTTAETRNFKTLIFLSVVGTDSQILSCRMQKFIFGQSKYDVNNLLGNVRIILEGCATANSVTRLGDFFALWATF